MFSNKNGPQVCNVHHGMLEPTQSLYISLANKKYSKETCVCFPASIFDEA